MIESGEILASALPQMHIRGAEQAMKCFTNFLVAIPGRWFSACRLNGFITILKDYSVTLQSYSSDEMDEFAVRLFDISAQLRGISKDMRINQIDRFTINDKKALVMCELGWPGLFGQKRGLNKL